MENLLQLDILPQPDDNTCGPTCLHAVYRYYGDEIALDEVIRESPQLKDGGTLAAHLGRHALRRGYQATIFSFNLQVFDPTWFRAGAPPLVGQLVKQRAAKQSPRLERASEAYQGFLESGGTILMEDLTSGLVRRYLNRDTPILTGLSSTYLYRVAREYGPNFDPDEIRGYPAGHFVVLCGYDRPSRSVLLADPLMPNPLSPQHHYVIGLDRVICAILLGILTDDANLLIIEPCRKHRRRPCADSHRLQ
jgi:hypothetical protein